MGPSDFFKANAAQMSKTQEAINSSSSTGQMNQPIKVPGSYLMKVRSFVMKKKNETTVKPFPNVIMSETTKTKGDLQLSLNLEVIDGTEAVPKGSNIFYTLTLMKAEGTDGVKALNTLKFMKPVICALTGLQNFEFTEKFVTETLMIDYDTASLKITREHKMDKTVMCVVEESVNPTNNQVSCRIKSIRPATVGEKSVSIKQEKQENSSLDPHQTTMNEITKGQGAVTVEATELTYDAAMDANDEFKVEDN